MCSLMTFSVSCRTWLSWPEFNRPMLFALPALELDKFGAAALAECACGGGPLDLVELENSELRGCGVGVVCVGSDDFEPGLENLASFVGPDVLSSFEVSTRGARGPGFGAATLLELVVVNLGAGRV